MTEVARRQVDQKPAISRLPPYRGDFAVTNFSRLMTAKRLLSVLTVFQYPWKGRYNISEMMLKKLCRVRPADETCEGGHGIVGVNYWEVD